MNFSTLFLLIFSLYGCGKPITDSRENVFRDPLSQGVKESIVLDLSMSFNFYLLPLSGEVRKDQKFWSGDSWRLKEGAINKRWNTKQMEGFTYLSPTRREAFTMPLEKLKELSPSEKFDLYMGRYDYPLRWEVDTLARSGTMNWEGLCHGWAGATLNHKEPSPKTVTNPDGIEIPFGSSDIKALLSYAYSKILIKEQDSIGKRCESPNFIEEQSEDFCNDDLSAASFHAVMANYIGLRGRSVIADIDRYQEVWNHPIIAYDSSIEKSFKMKSGKRHRIKTRIAYLEVTKKNSWIPHKAIYSYQTLVYELLLDSRGNITDGKWLSRERPDFLWSIKEAENFEGYLSGLKYLLK